MFTHIQHFPHSLLGVKMWSIKLHGNFSIDNPFFHSLYEFACQQMKCSSMTLISNEQADASPHNKFYLQMFRSRKILEPNWLVCMIMLNFCIGTAKHLWHEFGKLKPCILLVWFVKSYSLSLFGDYGWKLCSCFLWHATKILNLLLSADWNIWLF